LNDKKKDLLINDGYEDDPREKRANCFAADMLIPRKYNEDILKAQSAAALRRISQELGVSVGIVAGRYQRLTGHWDYHKKLIRTFNWN
jgi:Zn-dependent peptidase ImmA (M78 family)